MRINGQFPAFMRPSNVEEFEKLPKWLLLDMLWMLAGLLNGVSCDDDDASAEKLRHVAAEQREFAKRQRRRDERHLDAARAG